MTPVISWPWVESCVALPLLGAAAAGLTRDAAAATRLALGVGLAAFACSLMAWLALREGVPAGPVFAVDGLSALLLPIVALLHLLTILATAKVKRSRASSCGHLAAEGLTLGAFAAAPTAAGLLTLFLALGTLPPLAELWFAGKPTRVFALHMGAFVALLGAGWAAVEAGAAAPGAVLLLVALLVRSGTLPAHLWVADLFEHASFGTALLFVAPLPAAYAATRLVVPIAPDWALQAVGLASLATAVYAAGMAATAPLARRFFAYLFLSHASLVLVGLEIHSLISVTGALCLGVSAALSLGGLGLTLRALEARYGRLDLAGHRGLYDKSPALSVGFLLTGLGSVGFPGTLGFVAAELLIDGAVGADPLVGVGLTVAAAVNGIAVVRAYLGLFTGSPHAPAASLDVTPRERFAVLAVSALIIGGGLFPQYCVNACRGAAENLLRVRAAQQGDPPSGTRPV